MNKTKKNWIIKKNEKLKKLTIKKKNGKIIIKSKNQRKMTNIKQIIKRETNEKNNWKIRQNY